MDNFSFFNSQFYWNLISIEFWIWRYFDFGNGLYGRYWWQYFVMQVSTSVSRPTSSARRRRTLCSCASRTWTRLKTSRQWRWPPRKDPTSASSASRPTVGPNRPSTGWCRTATGHCAASTRPEWPSIPKVTRLLPLALGTPAIGRIFLFGLWRHFRIWHLGLWPVYKKKKKTKIWFEFESLDFRNALVLQRDPRGLEWWLCLRLLGHVALQVTKLPPSPLHSVDSGTTLSFDLINNLHRFPVYNDIFHFEFKCSILNFPFGFFIFHFKFEFSVLNLFFVFFILAQERVQVGKQGVPGRDRDRQRCGAEPSRARAAVRVPKDLDRTPG